MGIGPFLGIALSTGKLVNARADNTKQLLQIRTFHVSLVLTTGRYTPFSFVCRAGRNSGTSSPPPVPSQGQPRNALADELVYHRHHPGHHFRDNEPLDVYPDDVDIHQHQNAVATASLLIRLVFFNFLAKPIQHHLPPVLSRCAGPRQPQTTATVQRLWAWWGHSNILMVNRMKAR